MNRKHLFLLLTLFIQASSFLMGQSFAPPSAQTADFIKYGNLPANKYTGGVSVNIPLYNINVPGFNENISVNYQAEGFRPSQHSGYVGLNWSLNYGGAIVREVNGIPDESYDYTIKQLGGNEWIKVHGLYHGTLNKTYSNENVFKFNDLIVKKEFNCCLLKYDNERYCEPSPDVFRFNFSGISGKFFIDYEGNVQVQCSGGNVLDVDLSKIGKHKKNLSSSHNLFESEIKITLDNGYEYYFGGIQDNLEYGQNLFLNINYLAVLGTKTPIVNSWYLKEVIAPNGKTLKYIYKKTSNNFPTARQGIRDSETNGYELHRNIAVLDQDLKFELKTGIFNLESYSEETKSRITSDIYYANKNAIIDKIVVDDLEIVFGYSNYPFYYYYNEDIYNNRPLKLSNIYVRKKITSNTKTSIVIADSDEWESIHNIEFNYFSEGVGRSDRLFLTSIEEDGKSPYIFDYYQKTGLPTHRYIPFKTFTTDYWGFWNYANKLHDPIPDGTYLENGDFNYTSHDREPNASLCNVAMLKQITYPTGGWTKLEYEPHKYNKRLERKSSDDFWPKLQSVTGTAGGARIHIIKDYDGKSEVNIREFKYKKDYISGGQTSSGALMVWPRYYYRFEDGNSINSYLKDNSFDVNPYDRKYITYNEVTEIINGKHYIVNEYSDYSTNQDDIRSGHYKIIDPDYYNKIKTKSIYENLIGCRTVDDRSYQRGKLIRQKFYNSEKKIVKSMLFNYQQKEKYIAQIKDFKKGSKVQASKLFYNSYRLDNISEVLYDESEKKQVSTYTKNYYNILGQLSRIDKSNSVEQKLSTLYKYPFDYLPTSATSTIDYRYCDSYSDGFKEMVDRNMLSFPIEITQMRNGKIIDSQLNLYKKTSSDLIKLYEVKKLRITNSIEEPLGGLSYLTTTGEYNGSEVRFLESDLYKVEAIYDLYDSFGNLLQYHKNDSVNNSFYYGYNNRYPIIVAKGVDSKMLYNAISEALEHFNEISVDDLLGKIDLMELADQKERWKNFNNYLLGLKSMEKAFITTYTYDFLGKITSETDANGIATYYEYDGFRRLNTIKDCDENVIKKLKYNYKK